MILRTLLLTFLFTLVRSADKSYEEYIKNLIDTVLETNSSKPEDNTSIRNPKTRQLVDETGESCSCVPYYLCRNGTINTDGTGFLDIRMGNVCEGYMDTCCKEPITTPIMPPPRVRNGCGQRRLEGVGFKITGHNNSEAEFGEFPWMVALLTKIVLPDAGTKMVYICGGALIHESVVLTAAHCIPKKKYDGEFVVRAGEWDTQTKKEIFPHQDRSIIQTIFHPEHYYGSLWNDFALLVVDKPFTLVENVDTVCLPSPGIVPLSNECYASGWGKDKFGTKGIYQVILKKVELPIVTKDTCTTLLRRTRLGPYFRLHDSFVCAGGIIGKDTCKGDGGGPLVCPVEGKPGTYEVTGLVSWGIGCGSETPGVYANVAYARPWIDKAMRELGYLSQ